MTLSYLNLVLGLLLLAVPGYLIYVYDRQLLGKAATGRSPASWAESTNEWKRPPSIPGHAIRS